MFASNPFDKEASTRGFEFQGAYARARVAFKAARFRPR
jgi:hypothetical protein